MWNKKWNVCWILFLLMFVQVGCGASEEWAQSKKSIRSPELLMNNEVGSSKGSSVLKLRVKDASGAVVRTCSATIVAPHAVLTSASCAGVAKASETRELVWKLRLSRRERVYRIDQEYTNPYLVKNLYYDNHGKPRPSANGLPRDLRERGSIPFQSPKLLAATQRSFYAKNHGHPGFDLHLITSTTFSKLYLERRNIELPKIDPNIVRRGYAWAREESDNPWNVEFWVVSAGDRLKEASRLLPFPDFFLWFSFQSPFANVDVLSSKKDAGAGIFYELWRYNGAQREEKSHIIAVAGDFRFYRNGFVQPAILAEDSDFFNGVGSWSDAPLSYKAGSSKTKPGESINLGAIMHNESARLNHLWVRARMHDMDNDGLPTACDPDPIQANPLAENQCPTPLGGPKKEDSFGLPQAMLRCSEGYLIAGIKGKEHGADPTRAVAPTKGISHLSVWCRPKSCVQRNVDCGKSYWTQTAGLEAPSRSKDFRVVCGEGTASTGLVGLVDAGRFLKGLALRCSFPGAFDSLRTRFVGETSPRALVSIKVQDALCHTKTRPNVFLTALVTRQYLRTNITGVQPICSRTDFPTSK